MSSFFVEQKNSRWDLRQPDNYGEAGEDCVVMWTSGLWNDWPCTNRGGLMCDQDAGKILTGSYGCLHRKYNRKRGDRGSYI